MTKKLVPIQNRASDLELSNLDDCTLADLLGVVQDYVEQYGENAKIAAIDKYWGSGCNAFIISYREETDSEERIRMAVEAKQQQAREVKAAKDLANKKKLLAKLKKELNES